MRELMRTATSGLTALWCTRYVSCKAVFPTLFVPATRLMRPVLTAVGLSKYRKVLVMKLR